MKYYNDKSKDYFSTLRDDIINMIDFEVENLLDVGCGDGSTAYAIKTKTNAKFVAGIEIFSDAADKAALKLDNVICGNIEEIEPDFNGKKFDLIVCADVLEHLTDPWKALEKLKTLLTENGKLIASIPNIAYFPVIMQILRDRFEYEESGVLDKTHYRFFTLHTIKKLFADCGYSILDIQYNMGRGFKADLLSVFSLGYLHRNRIYQYRIIAKKAKETA